MSSSRTNWTKVILAFFAGGAVAFSAWIVLEPTIDAWQRNPSTATQTGAGFVEPPRSASANPINEILRLWSGGEKEQAVDRFMQLSRMDESLAAYRLYELSEKEFVALDPEERERLKSAMVPAFAEMGRFAREVRLRADNARADRDLATCRVLLWGLQRLGVANRGEDVTELSNLVGKAIEEEAERELAQLQNARAKYP